MPERIPWLESRDHRDAIRRVLGGLRDGHLVTLPTDSTYALAASGLSRTGVDRLKRLRPDGACLALRSGEEARDWVPDLAPLARRLVRRCWPGPLTLRVSSRSAASLLDRLEPSVRDYLAGSGTITLCCPGHEVLLRVLRHLPGPLLLAHGDQAELGVGQAEYPAADDVGFVVDAGRSRFGGPATEIEVGNGSWTVVREGVIPVGELRQQAVCVIVFVCTGNTCRSPLAEVLCKKLLADRLGCRPHELPQRGYLVLSAGMAAMPGGPATPEADLVAQEYGADLRSHSSRPLSSEIAAAADYLLVMTHSHLQALMHQSLQIEGTVRLLSPSGEDVVDPIGMDPDAYRACGQQIWQYLEEFVSELHRPEPPGSESKP